MEMVKPVSWDEARVALARRTTMAFK